MSFKKSSKSVKTTPENTETPLSPETSWIEIADLIREEHYKEAYDLIAPNKENASPAEKIANQYRNKIQALFAQTLKGAPKKQDKNASKKDPRIDQLGFAVCALEFYAKLAEKQPKPEYFVYLGCLHLRNGNLKQALIAFKKATEQGFTLKKLGDSAGQIFNNIGCPSAIIGTLKEKQTQNYNDELRNCVIEILTSLKKPKKTSSYINLELEEEGD